LRTSEREHHELLVVDVAERRVHQLDRRDVAPVQVLEHQHERVGGAFGEHEVLPGAADLIAHQLRILAGRAELDAGVVRKGRAHHLADELGDALLIPGRHVARHAREELVLARGERLLLHHPGSTPERLGEQGERGARAHRVPPSDPDLRAVVPRLDLPQDLVAEPRFADAGGAGDDDGARDRLGDAFVVRRHEHRELPLAPDARGRTPEERAGRVRDRLFAQELELAAGGD